MSDGTEKVLTSPATDSEAADTTPNAAVGTTAHKTKPLSEMTLDGLWQLFPIILTKPKPEWKAQYEELVCVLKSALIGHKIVRISHIGSTAVGFIWAKPTVDILVELAAGEDMGAAAALLCENGLTVMARGETRISLNLGYTQNGFADKVYHVHLRFEGDNEELYFMDYLMEHEAVAKEYEALKLKLWKLYEHDRDGYTEAKTEFITRYSKEARRLYGERYEADV